MNSMFGILFIHRICHSICQKCLSLISKNVFLNVKNDKFYWFTTLCKNKNYLYNMYRHCVIKCDDVTDKTSNMKNVKLFR